MTTGLRPESFEHLQLNAGLFLKNFDFSTAEDATTLRGLVEQAIKAGTGVIGATRGGGTFQCKPNIRQLEADGMRSPFLGSTVNDGWTVKLTGTMLEITPENFASALMSAEVVKRGAVSVLQVRTDIRDSDYIPKLCWIGDTARGLVLIELTNALNVGGASFTFTDKGEGTLPFEFQAHQTSMTEQNYAPFRIVFFDEEATA